MVRPTQNDAQMYIQLLALTQNAYHVEARRFVLFEFEAKTLEEYDRKYPNATPERDKVLNVLGFFEACGVLVSRGLLHEDVFLDAPFALEVIWPKMAALVGEWREKAGHPSVWENVEWLARRQAEWMATRWQSELGASAGRGQAQGG